MRLKRQCTRCCEALSLLGHALLDARSRTHALWLLARIADFLLKVHSGEWDGYHPLRQRVYFRQLAADIAGALHSDLADAISPSVISDCESAVQDFLEELQSLRHYPARAARGARAGQTAGDLPPGPTQPSVDRCE